MKISVHLYFDGQCEEAFARYATILGGEIAAIFRWGASPMASRVPAEFGEKVLHACLVVGENELLGADLAPGEFKRAQGFCVTLERPDPERARQTFDALAEGGEVVVAYQETFWSPGYGMVVDRFGIPWEINCVAAPGADDGPD